MVTQEELATIFYANRATDQLTLIVKARISKGEEVEPGMYTAAAQDDEEIDLDENVGLSNLGLDLDRRTARKRQRRAKLFVCAPAATNAL